MKKRLSKKKMYLEMIERLAKEVEMHSEDYHHKTTPGLLEEAKKLLEETGRKNTSSK